MMQSNNRAKESFYRFDDEKKEIVFLRHDMPTPWINYLTNGTFFTMMSQAGGNLSWYKTPEIWRIGRYNFYNLPVDVNGMFIYVKDEKNGIIWSPTVIPCNVIPDKWESAHGLGYTRFSAEYDGVTVNVKYFVGEANALVCSVSVSSVDDRKIKIFAAQEMGMMEYLREVQWQCYCKNSNNILYDSECDALVYEYFTDAQKRPDETPFVLFTADRKCSSYSGSRADFIGYYRDLKNPVAIENGACPNTDLRGGEAMFSMSFDIDLRAGKEEKLNIFLGTVEQTESVKCVADKLKAQGFAEESFKWLCNYWGERTSKFSVSIPDSDSERMMNIWNPLQALVNFYVCREISFYATGSVRGVGVRDATQDVLANVLYDIEASKKKLKLILTQQYNCGKTNHYFYPEEKNPPIVSDRSDNHLWMVYTAYKIIMEEGKCDFLFETVPYYDGGEGSVLEHLKKAITYTVENLGRDGIPLMLGSDWNDMLCNVCKKGEGESVFVSQMLILACKQMNEICELINEPTDYYMNIAREQERILNEDFWDGKWFIRAVTDEGVKLGKSTDKCAKIWINSQSWAVMSESCDRERGLVAMKSVLENLDSGFGLMKLNPPLQRNYPTKETELTPAQPGTSENGGVFCHANTWAIIALCMLGENDEAYRIYRDLIPENIVKKIGVDSYNAEPYIYSSNIRAPIAMNPGQAGVSWLSGTASWMMIAIEEYIFGIKPRFDGLKISPAVPSSWESASIKRVFRGHNVDITIHNEGANPHSRVKKILVDGKESDTDLIKVTKDIRVDVYTA